MSDYDVGYGKPPAEHRFKPGQSGNRRGRPKKAQPKADESNADILKRLDEEKIKVGGKMMTRREARLRVLDARALRGELRAIQMLEKMREDAEVGKAQPPSPVLLLPAPVPLHEWEASA